MAVIGVVSNRRQEYHLGMSAEKSRSANGAYSLARRFVTCPDIYQQESKKIFGQSWICAGHISKFHVDQIRPLQFENNRLIVVGDGHQLRVFRNFCRHRGSQLIVDGSCGIVGQRIQCPYHAWTYDRSGKLVAAPNMEGVKDFDHKQFGLIEVASEISGGFLWFNFAPTISVSEFLNLVKSQMHDYQIDQLGIASELEYEVRANWKLIFQNYSECYHCPNVHPILNRLTPYKDAANDVDSGPILGGPMQLAAGIETMSMDGKRVADYLTGLEAQQKRLVNYYTIFPTIFLSNHPDYVLIHRLERLAIDRTRVTCQFLFHPHSIASPSFDPTRAIEFWDLTNRQDWDVCELAQAGMEDVGYEPGPYSNLESVLAAFDRYYLQMMR